MSDPSPPGGLRNAAPRSGHDLRKRYRAAFWISMGLSVAFHAAIVLLYPNVFQRLPAGVMPYGTSAPATEPRGTQLINLEEVPAAREPQAPATEEEHPEAEPEAPTAPSREPAAEGPERPTSEQPEEATTGGNVAERLQHRAGDLRIWAPLDPELHKLSEEEVMRLQLLARIEALADSVESADELAKRLTDWTYTDSQGRKWGISPGQLHLGDITLPLPSFGVKGESLERQWEWDRMQGAAARADVLQTWKERDEAIRRRMNAERKPDTTRIKQQGG